MIKNNKAKLAGYTAAILLAAWSYGSWYVVKDIEKPSYQILGKTDDYEVRLYKPYIVAQTTVSGDYDEAMSDGFREIAGYIFGGNTTSNKISMTAPVLENAQDRSEQQDASQQIAMTAPVLDSGTASKRTVAFVMPSQYSLEDLPIPNSDKVNFAEIPARKMAVLSYGFYASEKRIEAKKKQLIKLLEKDGVRAKGEVISARYNPPLSMPLFIHNEVMVEID